MHSNADTSSSSSSACLSVCVMVLAIKSLSSLLSPCLLPIHRISERVNRRAERERERERESICVWEKEDPLQLLRISSHVEGADLLQGIRISSPIRKRERESVVLSVCRCNMNKFNLLSIG